MVIMVTNEAYPSLKEYTENDFVIYEDIYRLIKKCINNQGTFTKEGMYYIYTKFLMKKRYDLTRIYKLLSKRNNSLKDYETISDIEELVELLNLHDEVEIVNNDKVNSYFKNPSLIPLDRSLIVSPDFESPITISNIKNYCAYVLDNYEDKDDFNRFTRLVEFISKDYSFNRVKGFTLEWILINSSSFIHKEHFFNAELCLEYLDIYSRNQKKMNEIQYEYPYEYKRQYLGMLYTHSFSLSQKEKEIYNKYLNELISKNDLYALSLKLQSN
jgi:hypothetical protein